MTDTYRGGYKKALLDVKQLIERAGTIVRTKKATTDLIGNFLMFLLKHPDALDEFMDTQNIDVSISKDGKVIDYGGKYHCFS